MSYKQMYYTITYNHTHIDITTFKGIVIEVSDIASWALHGSWKHVKNYYFQRCATIERKA